MPKRGWEIPEREATPEDVYMNRRKFMVAAGGALGALAGCGHEKIFTPAERAPTTPTEEPQQPQPPQQPQQPRLQTLRHIAPSRPNQPSRTRRTPHHN
ncbi:MAG: twin-arginine translocation signal domain-containing protein, partial [Gemmatimonadetes bacterium]|nr:twin-arginine translocation signal domain-containing protein [Gemmatimonadota bacterium]